MLPKINKGNSGHGEQDYHTFPDHYDSFTRQEGEHFPYGASASALLKLYIVGAAFSREFHHDKDQWPEQFANKFAPTGGRSSD